jgi:hypothetical protein
MVQYHLRIRSSDLDTFQTADLEAENLLHAVTIALDAANGLPCELWQAGKRLILIDCGEISS